MSSDSPGGGSASSSTPSGPNGRSGGAGRGRGRGGRGRYSGRGEGARVTRQSGGTGETFKGKTDGLSGYVYDLSDIRKSSTQYVETTKEIVEYIGRNYKEGRIMKHAITHLVQPVVEEPDLPIPPVIVDPTALTPAEQVAMTTYRRDEARYGHLLKQAIQTEKDVSSSMSQAFSLIIGQCTPRLRNALESRATYGRVLDDNDPVELLRMIRAETRQDKEQKHPAVAVTNALRSLFGFRQGEATNDKYIKEFRNTVEAIEDKGIDLSFRAMTEWSLSQLDPPIGYEVATAEQRANAAEAGKEQLLAVIMMTGANQKKYGRLVEDTANDYLKGSDRYPQTMTQTANLLNNWRQDPRNYAQVLGTINDGVTFAQQQKGQSDVTCYRCGRQGHISTYCQETAHLNGTTLATQGGEAAGDNNAGSGSANSGEETAGEGIQFFTVGTAFHQSGGNGLTPTTVLLDSCSDVDVFSNPRLLTNIRDVGHRMNIRSTAGVSTTTQMGTLRGYGRDVWYFKDGVANILALCNVEKEFPVSYQPGEFTVTRPDKTTRVFKQVARGVYGCDLAGNIDGSEERDEDDDGLALALNSVEGNASKYTVRQYRQALLARRVHNSIGFPSLRKFLKIVDGNMIQNCPVTRDDVLIAEDIFGPNLGALKGKTVRRNPPHVRVEYTGVPRQLVKTFKNVTMAVDIMFVNKMPFFVTVSRNLKFRTAQLMDGRRADHAASALSAAVKLYPRRGFRVNTVLGDREFEAIRDDVSRLGATLQCAAADMHVPEIERQIRTIK